MKLRCAGVGVLMVGIIIGTSAMGMLQGFLRQKYHSKWHEKAVVDIKNKIKKGLVILEKKF